MTLDIRYSSESDYDRIRSLIRNCVGGRLPNDYLDNLDCKYVLAFNNNPYNESCNELVGLIGIEFSQEFSAYRINVVAIKNNADSSVLTALLKYIRSRYTDKDIYVSCWHYKGDKSLPDEKVLSDFNFVKVLPEHVKYNALYKCKARRTYCPGFNKQINDLPCNSKVCSCYEDLYLLKAEGK